MTLEEALIAALAAGDRARAIELATELHARGIDIQAIEAALAAQPQLEEQLWQRSTKLSRFHGEH